MRQDRSPGTGRRYPLTMICAIYRLARSSVYATASTARATSPSTAAGKRGPRTAIADAELVEEIRAVLAACRFHGEGYRKVRARLAHRGDRVSGKRVLRLMRLNGLLAPRRLGPPNGNPAHDGTIITDRPDVMWGTDGTRFYTEEDGCAGSSGPSTTISRKWSAPMSRRRAIAGRRSSPSAKVSATCSADSARTSRAAWRSGATGARSTSRTRGSTR